MAVLIYFKVDGLPAPQGSKRAFHHAKTGKIMMLESSDKVKPWRQAVAHAAMEAMKGRPPLMCPLRMTVLYRLPRPKAHYGKKGLKDSAPYYRSKTPDLSKLQRSTEDALTGIVYVDDSQIVRIEATKVYGEPGALIEITQIE